MVCYSGLPNGRAAALMCLFGDEKKWCRFDVVCLSSPNRLYTHLPHIQVTHNSRHHACQVLNNMVRDIHGDDVDDCVPWRWSGDVLPGALGADGHSGGGESVGSAGVG